MIALLTVPLSFASTGPWIAGVAQLVNHPLQRKTALRLTGGLAVVGLGVALYLISTRATTDATA